MQLTTKTVLRTAASAALLFAIAAPVQAQSPIADGAGLTSPGPNSRAFAFSASYTATGQVQGTAVIHVHNIPDVGEAFIRIDITSMAYDAANDLILGGVVVDSMAGTPVGTPVFFSVRDAGPGGRGDSITKAIDFIGFGNPFATAQELVDGIAPFGLTFEQLIGFSGFGFDPIAGGNITVH